MSRTVRILHPSMFNRNQILGLISSRVKRNPVVIKVVYGSQTGNTKIAAESIKAGLESALQLLGHNGISIELCCINTIFFEDLGDKNNRFLIFMLSTMIEGAPSDDARLFYNDLLDAVNDFRYDRDFLSGITYTIAGFGNDDFDNYCTPARNIDKWLSKLSAKRALPVVLITDNRDLDGQIDPWFKQTLSAVEEYVIKNASPLIQKSLGNVSSCGCNKTTDCCKNSEQQKEKPSLDGNANSKKVIEIAGDNYLDRIPLVDENGNKLSNNVRKKLAMKLRQQEMKQVETETGLKIIFASNPKPTHKPSIDECSNDENNKNGGGCCKNNNSESKKNSSCCKTDKVKDETNQEDESGSEEGGNCCNAPDSDNEDEEDDSDEGYYDEENDVFFPPQKKDNINEEAGGCGSGGEGDLEDLAQGNKKKNIKMANNGEASSSSTIDDRPEMVTSRHRKQLTNEGYKIIGSHSAVKLCRWTKHHLRGRGGCYKHSFYGITSYQCMEATPSLACANKCVFCWRHHKNPVGKSWRWKEDSPSMIVSQAVEEHVRMINSLKGVPGVVPERLKEAYTVRHCALSLVGEPIMYPQINEMLNELHKRNISSFLVTNAQFPEAIRSLVPVTQLYVSIDAATPKDLKEIDRPLFSDYWERLVECLTALREKQQRTTYRLTLVKRYNLHGNAMDEGDEEDNEAAEELKNYGKLVRIGEPDLIEVKAVTFCGTGGGSDLTIKDVPWPDEVIAFCRGLLFRNPDLAEKYDIACEHRHSCSVLICKKSFRDEQTGAWRTWINYERFHELVREGKPFTPEDYWEETPSWALMGSDARGFDPSDVRAYRNGKKEKSLRMHAESESRLAGTVIGGGTLAAMSIANRDREESDRGSEMPPEQPEVIEEEEDEDDEHEEIE